MLNQKQNECAKFIIIAPCLPQKARIVHEIKLPRNLIPHFVRDKRPAIQRGHRAYAILRHFVTANPNRTTNTNYEMYDADNNLLDKT